jgi:hypothetical protein
MIPVPIGCRTGGASMKGTAAAKIITNSEL